MPKILFIGAHRFNRSPSQRFRFEQYWEYFKENGLECHLSPLLLEGEDKVFYGPGAYLEKAAIVLKGYRRRQKDIEAAKDFDLIFIQREAIMTATTRFERAFKASGKKILFDYDDAIWLPNISEGNRLFGWMKNPAKTASLIALADRVIAGNDFLAEYGKRFNSNVVVIPTTIDTDYHKRTDRKKEDPRICIGWTGSHTTIAHFERAVPVLEAIKKKFGHKVYFKVIGDAEYVHRGLGIQGLPWNLETEIADLAGIDIGIMPLPDTEWAKGKCGLKGLQYMALEIPCVMSDVGVNSRIVSEGKNGFLARTEQEWTEKISGLIKEESLRKEIGGEARKTVEAHYSVRANKEKYLACLRSLL